MVLHSLEALVMLHSLDALVMSLYSSDALVTNLIMLWVPGLRCNRFVGGTLLMES
jgi:hypothetical protein